MAGHSNESTKAIFYALGANIGITFLKGLVAFWTGSGAMLAETIHSVADCGNQLLLLIGMTLATRPATANNPLGQGREMYFWSLIVALLLFTVGGLFSVYEGIERLLHPEPVTHAWLGVGVLVINIALEYGYLWGALSEVGRNAIAVPPVV